MITSNVFATLQKLDPLHTHDVVRTTFGHDDYTHGHTNQALSRIFVVQQTIQKSDEHTHPTNQNQVTPQNIKVLQ